MLAAGALAALSVGLFWMERVALTPSADTDATYAILGDEDIRLQLANVVSGADAAELGVSPAELRDRIEGWARIRDMSREVRGVVADAHAKLIGEHDGAVTIASAEQVQLVRSERVALQPPIALPVQRVTVLAWLAVGVTWTWMVAGGLAVVGLVLGLLLRPERGEVSFALSATCAAAGASLAVLGYLVPAFVLPALSSDVWAGALARLAARRAATTAIASAALVVLGAVVFLATTGARQRRARSTPLSVGRYREQQRWSG